MGASYEGEGRERAKYKGLLSNGGDKPKQLFLLAAETAGNGM